MTAQQKLAEERDGQKNARIERILLAAFLFFHIMVLMQLP